MCIGGRCRATPQPVCRLAAWRFARSTPATERVEIDLGDRSHPILIMRALIDDPAPFDAVPRSTDALIVTNTTGWPLVCNNGSQPRWRSATRVHTVTPPDGEAFKHWQTLNLDLRRPARAGCDRKTVLYALPGGGVVGDMTGFVAALRCGRALRPGAYHAARADRSSVGGKTGINHQRAKDMIGAFYQPRLVACDLSTLATLPRAS